MPATIGKSLKDKKQKVLNAGFIKNTFCSPLQTGILIILVIMVIMVCIFYDSGREGFIWDAVKAGIWISAVVLSMLYINNNTIRKELMKDELSPNEHRLKNIISDVEDSPFGNNNPIQPDIRNNYSTPNQSTPNQSNTYGGNNQTMLPINNIPNNIPMMNNPMNQFPTMGGGMNTLNNGMNTLNNGMNPMVQNYTVTPIQQSGMPISTPMF